MDHAEYRRHLPTWVALGMTDIHKYPNVKVAGNERGKPVTIYTWQVSGRLGNLTVNFVQPAEGQLNSYNDFLESIGTAFLCRP